MAIIKRKRFSYDKSGLTEAMKSKAPNLSDLEKEIKQQKETIKKYETRFKLLENKISQMTALLKKHHSRIVSLNSELLSTSSSIDNIKRAQKVNHGRK